MAIKKESNKTFHFRQDMSRYVIIHHKKKIINRIEKHLENVKQIENPNYYMVTGDFFEKKVTLIATSMGAGNTGIVVDQAISQGADYIFKFGTFGALQEDIEIGDIFIPNGAVRAEGITDAYAPVYFPAIPDAGLFNEVINKAKDLDITTHSGIIHSVNIYGPYMESPLNPEKYSPDIYRNINVFGVEMETSSVFTCSFVKKAKSVAILICNRDWKTIDGFRKGEEVNWDKHQAEIKKDEATKDCIKLILEVIKTK